MYIYLMQSGSLDGFDAYMGFVLLASFWKSLCYQLHNMLLDVTIV